MSVLDIDAVRAVTRLIDKGFEAYLVGGCVRDLLLDRTPKDYDIATEARPPQVKRTFPRNCRIIGRRFKLAHLHFHGNTKILECSTFRRTPEERPDGEGDDADLLITRDNEFGTAVEDALRRDFTVNALFLDPTRDLIVDHVNGLEDIEDRVIRTIGDPVVRFREDPVRILRAVKFAGRLDFTIEKQTLNAMAETAEDLVRAAPPRVLEEILRLMRSGHAHSSFQLLQDVGAIQYLIPVVGQFLAAASDEQLDSFWSLLDALDRRVQSQPVGSEPPPNGVLLAVLMYGAVEAERERQPSRSASSLAEHLLGSLAIDLRLPRRDSGCLKRICGVQHRFDQPESKRRFRVDSFVHSPYFEEALQLFALRTAAAGLSREQIDHWYDFAGTHPLQEDDHDTVDAQEATEQRAAADHEATDHEATDHEATDHEDSDHEDVARDHSPQPEELGSGTRKKRRRRRRRSDGDDDAQANREDATSQAPVTAAADEALDRTEGHNAPKAYEELADDESASADPVAADEEPKKRSRKRAPRRKVRAEDEDLSDVMFPSSDEPAPHGDPMQAPSRPPKAQDARAKAQPFPKDDHNYQAERVERERSHRRHDADHRARHVSKSEHDDRDYLDVVDDDVVDDEVAAEQGDRPEADADQGSAPRRPRRRRSRRSNVSHATDDDIDREHAEHARDDDDDDDDHGHDVEATPANHDESDRYQSDREDAQDGDGPARKRRRRGRRGRGRSRDGDGDGDDRSDARPQLAPAEGETQSQARHRDDFKDRPGRQDRAGKAEAKPQPKAPKGRERNQKKRDGRRDQNRDPGQRDAKRGRKPVRTSGARDVDVVPRYRDRRGKVEVIEPAALDLSAFDVELDPKRVPTFGSIVEGKGRPKRRAPRPMDGEGDGYRPPPPPGSDGSRPDAPPPPPPIDAPDTFGDW